MSGFLSSPVIGGIISGAASLFGGAMANQQNAANTAATNALNYQMFQEGNNFNQQQADINRQFQADMWQHSADYNAQQVQQQEAFQQGMFGQAAGFEQQMQQNQQDYARWSQLQSQDYNTWAQKDQQSYEAGQAELQRQWQAQMSGTAYQRSVADMKAAGLNPILGVASGGASTPSGAMPSTGMASSGTTSISSPGISVPSGASASMGVPGGSSAQSVMSRVQPAHMEDILTPAMSNALRAYTGVNDARMIDANLAKTAADTAATQQSAVESQARTGLIAAQQANAKQQGINLGMEPGKIQSEIEQNQAAAGASGASAILSRAQAATQTNLQRQIDQTAVTAKSQDALNQAQADFYRSGGGSSVWNRYGLGGANPANQGPMTYNPSGPSLSDFGQRVWNMLSGNSGVNTQMPSSTIYPQ